MKRNFTNDLLVSVLFLDPADPRRNRAEHIIAGDRLCTDECLALQSFFREMAEHPLHPNKQQVDRILGALYA